jgi:hypothetical protein
VADESTIEIYNVNTKAIVQRADIAGMFPTRRPNVVSSNTPYARFHRIAYSPDGNTLALADGEQIHVWDITTGKLRYSIGRNHPLASMLVFIAGLSLWAAAWGIVRKGIRNRRRVEPPALELGGSHRQIECSIPVPPHLRICWALMVLGGLVAIAGPIWAIFVLGPIMLFLPPLYLSLWVGLSAIARGAACDTIGLQRVAWLQIMNIVACDPVNFVLATLESVLINTKRVQAYLRATNS